MSGAFDFATSTIFATEPVVERVGHVEMLGSQLLLEDSQGLLAERFGCSYLP